MTEKLRRLWNPPSGFLGPALCCSAVQLSNWGSRIDAAFYQRVLPQASFVFTHVLVLLQAQFCLFETLGKWHHVVISFPCVFILLSWFSVFLSVFSVLGNILGILFHQGLCLHAHHRESNLIHVLFSSFLCPLGLGFLLELILLSRFSCTYYMHLLL